LAAALLLSLPAGPSFAQQGDSTASRIGRLEEQIADLKVMVGTLESLLRTKPGAVLPQESGATGPGNAQMSALPDDLVPRVEALETQIGALTSQLEQIGRQMAALEARLSATPAPVAPTAPLPASNAPSDQQGQALSEPADTALASGGGDTSKPRWFGPKPGEQETAVPGGESPQSLIPQGDTTTTGAAPGPAGEPRSLAALPNSNAQSLYQEGYGALLQHDYPAAEAAFRQLVDSYPDDTLAGSAQYWLGESYYVRGQYKSAADAFLTGYKKYKSGEKAPDTLLKLGMSLAALGQKDAACSTFTELNAKFPAAPDHIRDQAKGESKKTGC
jgi:tol-pal system protein YbgF